MRNGVVTVPYNFSFRINKTLTLRNAIMRSLHGGQGLIPALPAFFTIDKRKNWVYYLNEN